MAHTSPKLETEGEEVKLSKFECEFLSQNSEIKRVINKSQKNTLWRKAIQVRQMQICIKSNF